MFIPFLLALVSPLADSARANHTPFQDPVELYSDLFARSRVLAIGEANHTLSTGMLALESFLHKFGTDPKLKYIFIEGEHDSSPYFEALSVSEDPGLTARESDFASGPAGYCHSLPRSLRMHRLLPLVRELNQKRPAAHPLLIKSFDEIARADSIAGPKLKFVPGPCDRAPDHYIIFNSADRERGTAQRFTALWDELVKTDSKAVMLYHQTHLIREMKACMPVRSGDGAFTTVYESMSWMDHFLRQRPEARVQVKIVALDERDGEYAPSGVFKHTAQLEAMTPRSEWGLIMPEIVPGPQQSSLSLLQGDHFLYRYHELNPVDWQAGVGLHQMFDALVWNGKPEHLSRIPAPDRILPECRRL